jgi:hypothetical protein
MHKPYLGVDELGRVIPSPALLRACARDGLATPRYWNEFRAHATDSEGESEIEWLDAFYAGLRGKFPGAQDRTRTSIRARTRGRDQRDADADLDARYAARRGQPMQIYTRERA